MYLEVFDQDKPEETFNVFLLSEKEDFPDPLNLDCYSQDNYKEKNGANELGLYAIGSKISVMNLLNSYRYGIFPWFAFKYNEEPYWYCPQKRFVIFPEEIHVSHSMRTLLNKKEYKITYNENFEEVINNCRTSNYRAEDENAWLGKELMDVFIELHQKGFARSVEVWEDGEMTGGLYGFYQNGVFQGESMFSKKTNGSKIALIALAQYMKESGGKFIDCQFETPHFKAMGGKYISYKEYRELMDSL